MDHESIKPLFEAISMLIKKDVFPEKQIENTKLLITSVFHKIYTNNFPRLSDHKDLLVELSTIFKLNNIPEFISKHNL